MTTKKDIRIVIEKMEPKFRKAFLDAVNDIKSEAQLSVIVGALQDGRIEDAIRALHLTPEFFAPLDDALKQAYIEGGRNALLGLPVIADPAGPGKWLSALVGRIHGRRNGSDSDQGN
jgi:hypothetical protein